MLLTVFGLIACQKSAFFLLPPWWEYLQVDSSCNVAFTFPDDILAVGLALLDILLRIAGTVAVIMIVVAGVRYITASGNSEKAASARRTAVNSLIGLAITMVATGLVAFIGNKVG